MNPDLLYRAGQALFPVEGWQNALREALGGVNERVLRRWLAGTAPIPAGVWEEVRTLVQERRAELLDILRDMEAGDGADH